jgi:hypothetical protein
MSVLTDSPETGGEDIAPCFDGLRSTAPLASICRACRRAAVRRYSRISADSEWLKTYDAWSALANSPNSTPFKSDTAQNDIPLWIQ